VPRKKQKQTEPLSNPDAVTLRAAECEAVMAGLAAGTLDPQAVHERIIAAVGDRRVWQTAECKELRARLIKDACEQCGEKEGPMNLHRLGRQLYACSGRF
jgi:hypothetical protein